MVTLLAAVCGIMRVDKKNFLNKKLILCFSPECATHWRRQGRAHIDTRWCYSISPVSPWNNVSFLKFDLLQSDCLFCCFVLNDLLFPIWIIIWYSKLSINWSFENYEPSAVDYIWFLPIVKCIWCRCFKISSLYQCKCFSSGNVWQEHIIYICNNSHRVQFSLPHKVPYFHWSTTSSNICAHHWVE